MTARTALAEAAALFRTTDDAWGLHNALNGLGECRAMRHVPACETVHSWRRLVGVDADGSGWRRG
jgi:hypothetical protein